MCTTFDNKCFFSFIFKKRRHVTPIWKKYYGQSSVKFCEVAYAQRQTVHEKRDKYIK